MYLIMKVQIQGLIKEFNVERLREVVKKLLTLSLIPCIKYDYELLKLITYLPYRYEDFNEDIVYLIDLENFNKFIDFLKQQNVDIQYAKYSNFQDCIRLVKDNLTIAIICRDIFYEDRKLQRITYLDMNLLNRLGIEVEFISEGVSLSEILRPYITKSVKVKLPIYYILTTDSFLKEFEVDTYVRLITEGFDSEINIKSELVYTYVLSKKNLENIKELKLYLTDKIVKILKDYTTFIEEYQNYLNMYIGSEICLKLNRLSNFSDFYNIIYIDFELLKNFGIDFYLIELM